MLLSSKHMFEKVLSLSVTKLALSLSKIQNISIKFVASGETDFELSFSD